MLCDGLDDGGDVGLELGFLGDDGGVYVDDGMPFAGDYIESLLE